MFRSPKIPTVATAIGSCRGAFLVIFVVSAFLNFLMLTGPIFMLQVYDRVMASSSVPTLVVLAAIALSLYCLGGLLDILRARAFQRISMRVYARLADPALRTHLQLPLVAGQAGAAMQPPRDLEAIRRFLGSPGPAAIFDLPFMPLYFGLVFIFHAWLGWLAVAGGAAIFLLVLGNEFTSRAPSRNLGVRTSAQSRVLDNARRNAEVVNAMGMVGPLARRYVDLVATYYDAQRVLSDRSSFYSSTIKMLRLILQSAMLGLGAYLAIGQEISPGVMIASSIIMARALAPIEQAVSHWPTFVAARQAAGRFDQVQRQGVAPPATPGLPLPEKQLRVETLATGAPGEPLVLLQGVDFALTAGDGLGVIGASGSGKTSLLRAIVGVWPTHQGAVRFDGATLAQYIEADRGRFIGYLPQDVELFEGSVAENVARFDPEASMDAVVDAAKLAGVHQLIASLPDGYATTIGDGGARLSAGQRQRIGLARALYGTPFLVVLDEPNSNLDTEGEKALNHALNEMRNRGSIVIVVAHRTSALSAVNKLLRIEAGTQAVFGPRDEILATSSARARPAANVRRMPHAV